MPASSRHASGAGVGLGSQVATAGGTRPPAGSIKESARAISAGPPAPADADRRVTGDARSLEHDPRADDVGVAEPRHCEAPADHDGDLLDEPPLDAPGERRRAPRAHGSARLVDVA